MCSLLICGLYTNFILYTTYANVLSADMRAAAHRRYGMSDSIGPVFHTDGDLEKLSPSTREAVETEVAPPSAQFGPPALSFLCPLAHILNRASAEIASKGGPDCSLSAASHSSK